MGKELEVVPAKKVCFHRYIHSGIMLIFRCDSQQQVLYVNFMIIIFTTKRNAAKYLKKFCKIFLAGVIAHKSIKIGSPSKNFYNQTFH